MSTLNLRVGNDALTFQELDDNFTNLNNDKYEINDSPQFTAVGIGTAASSIALDISATNAIKIPVGTDAQRPTAATGMIRYNTTSSSFEGYSGTAWASLGGVKDVDGDTTILAESSAGADEDVLTFQTAGANSATLSSTQFDVEVNLDVTGTITASSTISGSNLSGTNTGDEPAASATVAGIVELATVSEVNTGTDTVRAVTPAGVAGFTGSANVVTLGTITTGTWNGSIIAEAYLQNQSGTNTGDEPDASATVKGIVELATVTEVNTGTDTVRAVTPAGVAGFTGSANVVTVGTITTGTWQGSAISTAYISNLSGTNTGDEPAASATVAGIVELATTAETTTGTDATRAVTPDGLKDGYQGSTNVTTLGTITTGTWNGSAISTAYISNLSGTNTGDEPAASATVAGIVELATTAETTTGTDTTRAVTPDGLKDGYQGSTNVTTLGTITTGTWNGSVIASAYLDSDTAHLSGTQTFSGLKTFSANVVVSAGYLSVGSDTSGPVGFSVNDGGGNANVWWNERGNAKQTAGFNSARIDVNVDASSGATMNLGVGSGASLATNRLSLTDAGGTFNGECDADTFQEALTTSTGGSYAVNCTTAGVHWRTLNAACTVSFTNTPDSNTSKSITLVFQQDATGGRVITWPTTNWYWAENIEPPQSTGANDIDVYNVQIINNGGTLYYYASLGVKNAS